MNKEKNAVLPLSILIIILSLVSFKLPILSLIMPIFYSVLATLSKKKFIIIYILVNTLILTITTNFEYSISFMIIYSIPGIFIGSSTKKQTYDKNAIKLEPIYVGIISTMISFILLYFVNDILFGIDLVKDFKSILKQSVDSQFKVLDEMNFEYDKYNITKDFVLSYIINLLPFMIFIQSFFSSFFTYYIQMLFLSKIRYKKSKIAKLSEFYLPGNISIVFLGMSIIMLLLSSLNTNLKIDTMLLNFQLVCITLIVFEGASVYIYFLKKWFIKKNIKNIIISFLVFGLFGFMILITVGLVDEIIDIRGLRSRKLT